MYRIRHKPTGKWIWHKKYVYGFSCILLPDEYNVLKPSEWENIDDVNDVMGTTTFGMSNLEIVEFKQKEEKNL